MIVLEGPDGGGKSTLITRLAERLDFQVEPRACNSEHGINMTTLKDWVDADLSRSVRSHGVYDRYPLISEPIYGPLTRGRMADGFEDVKWMGLALLSMYELEPLMIYCLPPLDAVRRNVQATHGMTTEHMSQVNHQIRAIWHAYCHRAALDHGIHPEPVVWDYTDPNYNENFERLVSLCREHI